MTHSAEIEACVCPDDYCLDDSADPHACPVCKRLDLYDPCPHDRDNPPGGDHE